LKNKTARIIAWGLTSMIIVSSVVQVALWGIRLSGRPTFYDWVEAMGWGLALPLAFSILAALIISRQHGNRVGWLMMVVALAINNPVTYWVQQAAGPPEAVSAGMWLLIWLETWSWVPVIFPIFLIPLYFPSGELPAPRWRWVTRSAITLAALFLFIAAFEIEIGQEMGWTLSNPIGFIPTDFIEGSFFIFWGIALLTTVSASVVSLFVRYRKASISVRQQIKWLLLAGVGFVIVYGLIFILTDVSSWVTNGWVDLALVLSVLGMPVAIAISIFRYRLWDLDVVINRALIYGPLTTFMAGIFAMVIALTTELTKEALGDQSKALGAAISAVIVAVIFQPLRDRITVFVDKRFYPHMLDLASGLVEMRPEYWTILDRETLVQLAMEHVSDVLGTEHAAFYLASDLDRFQLMGQLNDAVQGAPALTLSKKQLDGLRKKRVVASEDMRPLAGHVPLFIDRGKSIQLLGLLSIGSRANGRGYSGDDLKSMVDLGGKIGLALNAVEMRRSISSASDKWDAGVGEERRGPVGVTPTSQKS
jgi:hypothetical protein